MRSSLVRRNTEYIGDDPLAVKSEVIEMRENRATRGRPAWKPTAEQRTMVEAMIGYGVAEADVAKVLKVDAKTLRKHCRDELDLGPIKSNAKVSESLFKKATGSGPQSVTAAIWWERTRQGRKEISVTRHQGPDGGPVEYRNLSEEEVDRRIAELEAGAGKADAR